MRWTSRRWMTWWLICIRFKGRDQGLGERRADERGGAEERGGAGGADAAGDCRDLHVPDVYDDAECVCRAAGRVWRRRDEVRGALAVHAAGGGDLRFAALEEVGLVAGDGGVFAAECGRFLPVFAAACAVF